MKPPENKNDVCLPLNKTTHHSNQIRNQKETKMNSLIYTTNNTTLTMSSREIAELARKQHKYVIRDIRIMLDNLGTGPKFGFSEYVDTTGRKLSEYHLPKRETLILVSGYSIELCARIIDRWQKLEEQQKDLSVHELLSNPAHFLEIAASYAQQIIMLQSEKADMQEDVNALERIALADGSLCVTDAAKALQIRPSDLFNWLQQNGWIYKRTGCAHYLGYQAKTQAGLLEHKVTTVYRSDGTEKVTEQVRITAKGMAHLAKIIKPAVSLLAA